MKTLKYLWLACSLFILGSCESLEDTYGDYTEGGALRYLGKCRDLKVEPGWQRLIVSWANHVDPLIDKIKVSWSADGVKKDTLLEKDVVSCNIYNLANATYEVSVSSMDKDGNVSLPIIAYMRPYTAEHENVLTFTKVVNKYFYLKNRIVLFFDEWQSNVSVARLKYTTGGKEKILELDSAFVAENSYFLLPDALDANTKVRIERIGRLEGCEDLIEFGEHELSSERIFTPGFRELIREKYGITEITDEFLKGLTTLDIDYNIETFEDILHLSALKTLNLGKNRFLNEKYLADHAGDASVERLERSMFALQVAHEINGLDIQHYNNMFFPAGEYDFVQEKGNPVLVDKTYLSPEGWTYTWSEDEEDDGLSIDVLFDKDSDKGWQTSRHSAPALTHEIVVDMKEVKSLKGVKINQKEVWAGTKYINLLVNSMKIKVSIDGNTWENATYVENCKLGATNGEVNFVDFAGTKQARYLKFIVDDRPYNKFRFAVALGKIRIY